MESKETEKDRNSRIEESGEIECRGVRSKYAKPWKGKNSRDSGYFQLFTTYSNPGLVSIFYNEDQRSFHNWRLEVGSGNKRGRIREAIDHQINAPVLEIAGDHDGSVYMECPSELNTTINVDMPYVTILMKDMNGYSSVEFKVLDTLGFSRKICAKNFISQTTIGELNCEIPMRLSPAWNYACVNLDDTLQNAFGTKLAAVQGIKLNANVRVRRIYFHDELFPFKDLPQEYRIKLTLTPQEKQEIQMFEQFFHNEPPEKNAPWCLPKLVDPPRSKHFRNSAPGLNSTVRGKVEIMEVPRLENDPDKYTNIEGMKDVSNSGLLKEMLGKSIPPQKILLPTLSLIYPDKKKDSEAAQVQNDKLQEYLRGKGHSEMKFFLREMDECKDFVMSDVTTEKLRKIKHCINPQHTQTQTGRLNYHDRQTDWEKFHAPENLHDKHSRMPQSPYRDEEGGEVEGEYEAIERDPHSAFVRHHHHHCSNLNVGDLAQYVKHRETLGDYDMFTGTVGNAKFLAPKEGETDDNLSSSSISSDEEGSGENNEEGHEGHDLHAEHSASETPFSGQRQSHHKSLLSIRSSATRLAQDPSKSVDGRSSDGENLGATESWMLTWAFNGLSWAQTREVNQKLLNEARDNSSNEKDAMPGRKKSTNEMAQGTNYPNFSNVKRGPQKLPPFYRDALPTLPKLKKEELRGTQGYYDIVIDNPTLPIEYY